MAQDQKLHKLDDLFNSAKRYTKSSEYLNLINFCKRMRHLGPYNAMLASIQMPGAKFLLTADKWLSMKRTLALTARPVVILMPFSPVDFVFDLSDTFPIDQPIFEETEDDVLERIKHQFDPRIKYDIRDIMSNLYYNIQIDGIHLARTKKGTQMAGRIVLLDDGQKYKVNAPVDVRNNDYESVKAYYLIDINQALLQGGELLAIVHELGHLYCHHLPHPRPSAEESWSQRNLSKVAREFEAESVAEIVFNHFGLDTDDVTTSYIAQYTTQNEEIPNGVSPDSIFSAAGKIIQMLEGRLDIKKGLLYKNNKTFSRRVDRIRAARSNRTVTRPSANQGASLFNE